MTTPDMTLNLALALGVPPEEILGYRNIQHKGYNVIMRDFRKFTGVLPVPDTAVTAFLAEQNADDYPSGLPDDLKPTYDNPSKHLVQELKNLAYFLEIPDASALRKPSLIEEIEAWKKREGETQTEEETETEKKSS